MARTLWAAEDPLGQMISTDGGRRVVGSRIHPARRASRIDPMRALRSN